MRCAAQADRQQEMIEESYRYEESTIVFLVCDRFSIMDVVETCSNPGCDHPGTNKCSACKTTFYCGPICQTADWPHHKEECQGHLRKVGIANLAKAMGFHGNNWIQSLRCGELAATKLKQLKDRRLETVQDINAALECKYNALNFMGRHREALECAEERYTLWAMNQMRNPGSIYAAFALIQSCLHNGEYEDAERYARHAMFMIVEMTDNFIPVDQQPLFLAHGSYFLGRAIFRLAEAGGIPPEEKQKAGEEAIQLVRKALEIHTQLFGIESADVASDMSVLSDILDYVNDVDDDEVLRLREQSSAIYRRVEGSLSYNVAVSEEKKGVAYHNRANRADAVNDLDRCLANLELALSHFRDAARIYQQINHSDSADDALRKVSQIEESIALVTAAIRG